MACALLNQASVLAGSSLQARAPRPAASQALLLAARVQRFQVVAQAKKGDDFQAVKEHVAKAAALSTAAATFLAAGNAQAAEEIASLAARDSRLGALALLAVPALGWVAFNIGGPALNQLNGMGGSSAKPSKLRKRSIAAALGLGAAGLLMAQNADAASEFAQLADKDNRIGIIATLFLPVVGWVGFNILQPALSQLDNMNKTPAKKGGKGKKRSIAAGLGLGTAALLMAQNADAAAEIAQLADKDNRLGIIATLFLPVVGWVGFNILQPALSQLDNMGGPISAKPKGNRRKRSVAAGLGLAAASMLVAQHADAATQVADLAAKDNRIGFIATLFLPVVGWVGFNILQPALSQLDNMGGAATSGKAPRRKR